MRGDEFPLGSLWVSDYGNNEETVFTIIEHCESHDDNTPNRLALVLHTLIPGESGTLPGRSFWFKNTWPFCNRCRRLDT